MLKTFLNIHLMSSTEGHKTPSEGLRQTKDSSFVFSWQCDDCQLLLQIQTIAFLSHLYQKQIYGPFMIVAPLSTLANWVNEFERFCPALKTVLYHGSKKERSELGSKKLKIGEQQETHSWCRLRNRSRAFWTISFICVVI